MENLTENQFNLIAELTREFKAINAKKKENLEPTFADLIKKQYNEIETTVKEEYLKEDAIVEDIIDQYIAEMIVLETEMEKLDIPIKIEPIQWDKKERKLTGGHITIGGHQGLCPTITLTKILQKTPKNILHKSFRVYFAQEINYEMRFNGCTYIAQSLSELLETQEFIIAVGRIYEYIKSQQ